MVAGDAVVGASVDAIAVGDAVLGAPVGDAVEGDAVLGAPVGDALVGDALVGATVGGALVGDAVQAAGVDRTTFASSAMFMSHETYTPAKGGSAAAEIESLRVAFGEAANKVGENEKRLTRREPRGGPLTVKIVNP